MADLAPIFGALALTPFAPRIWLGPASANCWRMLFNSSTAQWELDGGNGLVRYTMSGTWSPNSPNVFDTILFDHTIQAPSSITVYPLSPLPCTCPGVLEPAMGVVNLTPYAPMLRPHIEPAMGELELTPFNPRINSSIPNLSVVTSNAYDFQVPSGSGLAFGGPVSMTMWIRPLTSGTGVYLDQRDPVSGARNFRLGLQLSGGNEKGFFLVDHDIVTVYAAVGTTNLTIAGPWYFLAGVYDGSNVYFWLDGALETTTAAPLSRGFADNVTRVGGLVPLGGTCHMLDVRLYNTNLSGTDIGNIYNSGQPSYSDPTVSAGNLLAWWKCNEGAGNVLGDSISSADATCTGTAVWSSDSP